MFQPIEKKDRKVDPNDYKKFEEMLNKKIKRRNAKSTKKEEVPKVEKEENKKDNKQKVEAPKGGEKQQ